MRGVGTLKKDSGRLTRTRAYTGTYRVFHFNLQMQLSPKLLVICEIQLFFFFLLREGSNLVYLHLVCLQTL